MEIKDLNIEIPSLFTLSKERSTFSKIVFINEVDLGTQYIISLGYKYCYLPKLNEVIPVPDDTLGIILLLKKLRDYCWNGWKPLKNTAYNHYDIRSSVHGPWVDDCEQNKIVKNPVFLTFPTREIRDDFIKNFLWLIYKVKDFDKMYISLGYK